MSLIYFAWSVSLDSHFIISWGSCPESCPLLWWDSFPGESGFWGHESAASSSACSRIIPGGWAGEIRQQVSCLPGLQPTCIRSQHSMWFLQAPPVRIPEYRTYRTGSKPSLGMAKNQENGPLQASLVLYTNSANLLCTVFKKDPLIFRLVSSWHSPASWYYSHAIPKQSREIAKWSRKKTSKSLSVVSRR